MKKVIALVMTLVLLCGALAVAVSAATKSDLLEAASKVPVYKYVKVSVENAARTVEITDEEAAALLPIVERAAGILTTDGGASYFSADGHNYSKEVYDGIMGCIDEACAVLGYTYKMTPVSSPKHVGDIVFQVFDENGKLVFEYDGDIVTDTSAAPVSDMTGAALLIGAVVLFGAGIAVLAVSRRKAMAA